VSSPFSHPDFLEELQAQKREAFDNYLDDAALNVLKGAAVGSLLSLALVRKPKNRGMLVGLWAGLGAGVATNSVAQQFNLIEQRENRILSHLRSIEGVSAARLEDENERTQQDLARRLDFIRYSCASFAQRR